MIKYFCDVCKKETTKVETKALGRAFEKESGPSSEPRLACTFCWEEIDKIFREERELSFQRAMTRCERLFVEEKEGA
jgi:hypothetical protein